MPLSKQPFPKDLSLQEAADFFYPLIHSGAVVYIKWVCPSCGERVTADDPMILSPNGEQVQFQPKYLHTVKDNGDPCMVSVDVYNWRFGCRVVYTNRG